MQLTAKHKVATPVNWKQGDDVIILPAVSNEEAQQKYPAAGSRPSRICGSSRSRSKGKANGHGFTRITDRDFRSVEIRVNPVALLI